MDKAVTENDEAWYSTDLQWNKLGLSYMMNCKRKLECSSAETAAEKYAEAAEMIATTNPSALEPLFAEMMYEAIADRPAEAEVAAPHFVAPFAA